MQNRHVSPAETGKLVRAILRATWPGTTFSVTSTKGYAVRVAWTDGPDHYTVAKKLSGFDGQGFDGSTDSTTYQDSWLWPDGSATLVKNTEPEPAPGEAERVSFPGLMCYRHYSHAADAGALAFDLEHYHRKWGEGGPPSVDAKASHDGRGIVAEWNDRMDEATHNWASTLCRRHVERADLTGCTSAEDVTRRLVSIHNEKKEAERIAARFPAHLSVAPASPEEEEELVAEVITEPAEVVTGPNAPYFTERDAKRADRMTATIMDELARSDDPAVLYGAMLPILHDMFTLAYEAEGPARVHPQRNIDAFGYGVAAALATWTSKGRTEKVMATRALGEILVQISDVVGAPVAGN